MAQQPPTPAVRSKINRHLNLKVASLFMATAPSANSNPAFCAKAIVLCAGRGQRMRPLTDTCPKPLLSVQGQPLLAWHLQALARAKHHCALINTAWQEQRLIEHFGNHYANMQLRYSQEGKDFGHALETAGGIARALPALSDIFWGIAGDAFAPEFDYTTASYARFEQSQALAHLFLVTNPAHNQQGDFSLQPNNPAAKRYTFSGIALYKKAFFKSPLIPIAHGNPHGQSAAIGAILHQAFTAGLVSTELYHGQWVDVGTPERLAQLNQASTSDHPTS